LFPPPGYLKLLKEMAEAHGALFIVDEAQTGFGRTGKWFAIEHHGVEPDILTLSKSIGNGFPAAAVMTTSVIAQRVLSAGLWNLSSHQSDPVAATAVSAVIDIVREENLMDRAAESGQYFLERLRDLAAKQPALANLRGQGLMIGFDFAPAGVRDEGEAVDRLMYACRRRGVHLTYSFGSKFRIIPPLVITRSEMDFAVETIAQSMAEAMSPSLPSKDFWPKNPYTSRLFATRRWKRLLNYWWRSSPAEIAARGRQLVRERLRADSQ
jgi:2,2-dialkylglycine decarboxylase (pyruvate)